MSSEEHLALNLQRRKTVALFQRSIMPYRHSFLELAAQKLGKQGVSLVVLSGDPQASTREINDNLRYIGLGTLFVREIAARDIAEKLVIPRGLLRALLRVRPDIVVTEDISALPANLAVPMLKIARGTPYLIWTLGPHIYGKRKSQWRFLFEPVVAALRYPANGFIGYSNWAQAMLLSKYGKPTYAAPNSTVSQTDVVENIAFRLDRAQTALSLILIYVGRLTAQKKLDVLFRAMKRAERGFTLHVIGEGSERTGLEELARSLGLSEHILFHGEVRDVESKQCFIDAADIGVLPGLGGLFIQEAQSRGCPVIAGPADGTEQDLVRKGAPEFYLINGTEDELCSILCRLSDDRDLLCRGIAAAHDIVARQYNLETMAENWADAVMQTLNRKA